MKVVCSTAEFGKREAACGTFEDPYKHGDARARGPEKADDLHSIALG
jgi:hypothetical protein